MGSAEDEGAGEGAIGVGEPVARIVAGAGRVPALVPFIQHAYRFLNYQSMMKQWLAERLEDELRRSDS